MTSTRIKPRPSLLVNHITSLSLEIYLYLQMKHFLTPLIPRDSSAPSMSLFEQACKRDPHGRGIISALYSNLLHSGSSTTLSYVTKWKRNLELRLDTQHWNHIWQATKSSLQNIVALESQSPNSLVFAPHQDR